MSASQDSSRSVGSSMYEWLGGDMSKTDFPLTLNWENQWALSDEALSTLYGDTRNVVDFEIKKADSADNNMNMIMSMKK